MSWRAPPEGLDFPNSFLSLEWFLLPELAEIFVTDRRAPWVAMEITQVGKYYPPYRGGMEKFLASLCQGLARRGVHCEVIVSQAGGLRGVSQEAGVTVRRLLTFGTVKSLPLSPGLLVSLRGRRTGLLHLHHPNPLADLSYLLARPQIPLVVTYHADIVQQVVLSKFHRPLLHYVLQRAAAIVVTSPQYADSSPVLSPFRNKIHIIPLGIESPPPAWLDPPAPRPAGEPQFLFVGRLVAYKGVEVLLQAMTQVKGRLWVAGAGPLEARLRRQACAAGLTGRVEFLGAISEEEKWRHLAACDALVLPSLTRAEAFGLVLLEAMAAGKPVVASDLPTGIRLLVQEGCNGLCVPPGDADALAAALNRLSADPAAARRMGEAGRAMRQRYYTTDGMVDSYLRLYREVVRRNGPQGGGPRSAPPVADQL